MVSLVASNFSDSFIEYNQIRELASEQKLDTTFCGGDEKLTVRQRIRRICSSITVEPVIFCYACALILHAPLIQQYIYHRLSEDYGLPTNVNVEASTCNVPGTNPPKEISTGEARKEVQSMTSYIYLGIILAAAVPSFFAAMLLGSWSDKVGRRVVLLMPVLGGLLDSVCILVVMFTRAPLYLLFFGSFCNGVCGFFTTMILAVFSYMADTTAENERALRLGILEAVAFVSGMISHISSGWWIHHLGFKAPYIFITSLHFLSAVYIIVYLPESLDGAHPKKLKELFHVGHFKKVFRVFIQNNDKIQLNGLLVTSAFLMIASIGFASVIVLYSLDSPFCLSPIHIGYFLADCMFMQAIGAIFALTLLQKVMSEIMLTQLGIISIASSLVMIAFSTKKWHLFIVPIAGCFGGVCMPVIRARMSTLVSIDQQGALFSAVATLETLCTLIGACIFNSLYPYIEKTFKFRGIIFILMASILVVPASILCMIGLLSYRSATVDKKKTLPTPMTEKYNE